MPEVAAVFWYWPAAATPCAVYFQSSPRSSRPLPLVSPPTKVGRKSSAGFDGVPASSKRTTLRSGSLPGLVTSYVQVTGAPTARIGPGAVRATWPLVAFATAIVGAAGVNEALASAWNWKSGPLTPLIGPRFATTVGGAIPGVPTNRAEGS